MAAERFVRVAAKYGYPATLQILTGDPCPCRLEYDGENPTYSPDWHDKNPGIENCNGTLLINRSEETVNVKFFITDIRLSETTQALQKTIKDAIGNLKRDDLAITGTADVDSMVFVDLDGVNKLHYHFTIDGKTYDILETFELRTKQLDGQLVILRRNG